MHIKEFKDKSREEWLKWRKDGIGASDIGVITGSNEYKTPLQLWEIKCGYSEEENLNEAMSHGVREEPKARDWINQELGAQLIDLCVEDDEKEYFRASLDGWDKNRNILVEIKSPISEEALERARVSSQFPQMWYDQLQWQMMIAKPEKAFMAIWDYRSKRCYMIEVLEDKKRIRMMREKADKFWITNIQLGKEPPLTDKDYREIEDPHLLELLNEYREIKEAEKVISIRKKNILTEVEGSTGGNNAKCKGFKIYKAFTPTTYNISQMKIDGVDVDSYVKDRRQYYRISCPKLSFE